MLSRLLRSSWPAVATTAVVSVALLLNSGMLARDVALFSLYVVVAVAMPGVFVWRVLLQRFHTEDGTPPTWFEDLSLGSIFGFGLQLPVYIVGVIVGAPLLVLALPVLVLVLSATRFGRRIWTLPTGRLDWRASWAFSVVILYGLFWLASKAFPLRPMSLPANRTPSVDETFHQALVAELAHRFPPQIPFLLDTRLDYHWFVHAQIATARWVTGIDSVVMLRQLVPALTLILTVLGLGAVTLRLTGRASAAVLAPALLVVGGFDLFGPHYNARTFSESFMSTRYVSSPSQSYGAMMSMPALMLILDVLRPKRKPGRVTWLALALALLALSGSKATFLPIFLCGAIVLWLFQLVMNRRVDRTATALLGLVFAATLFAQVVLFGLKSGSMAFMPFHTVVKALGDQAIAVTPVTAALMATALLIGWLLYGVGVVGLAREGRWRDPRAVWMIAAVPAGIVVPFLFYRSGLSQLWFQRSVAELVVLLSAWGMAYLLPNPLTRRSALTLGGIAATSGLVAFAVSSWIEASTQPDGSATLMSLALTVATPFAVVAVFMLVRFVIGRRGGRRPGVLIVVTILLGLGLTNAYALAYDTVSGRPMDELTFPPLFAAGGVDAAEFLRDHSSPHDIVATNAHCLSPTEPECDNRNFWVSAYTERRIVIEGWGYTAVTNARFSKDYVNAFIPTPYPLRLAINDAAFEDPSEETVGRLVDTYGVDWLFVSKDYPADVEGLDALTSMLDKRFENSHYVVYEVID